MIISIYGIPRSGKDTFIKKIISKTSNAIHIKGSQTLNNISLKKYKCKFKELPVELQEEVRILFVKQVKDLDSNEKTIIIDGHYSFPSGDEYNVVFTEEDLKLYDIFYYLKRTPEEIERNYLSDSKKDYGEILLSSNKVQSWMEFEITNMKRIIEENDKDFIVLDSDESALDFVINNTLTTRKKASIIVDEIVSHNKRKIVLTDLDKTISICDLTNDFIKQSQLDLNYPKILFKGDYYTSYQFYKFHKFLNLSNNYYEAIKCSIDIMQLNTKLINDLYKLKKEGTLIIAITTGMKEAWALKNKDINLFDAIYGYDNNDKLIVTPLLKKLVAKQLSCSNETLAFGDSILDIGMILMAKKGYLIASRKLDPRIIKLYESGGINKIIYQPCYSNYKYDFTKGDDVKW